MPRVITTAMLAALQSPLFAPVIFVSMQFNSATVTIWSGFGPIVWNSITWTGLGALLQLGNNIEDGATVEARGITLTLSGIDPTLLPDFLTEVQLTLPVTIWLGALSSPGNVIADPVILWSGGMDMPTINITAQDATIELNCENLLVSMDVPCDRRYTLQDSESIYPGDLGFQFVDALQEQGLYWGAVSNVTNQI